MVAALNDPLSGRFLWRPPFPYSGADFEEFYRASLTLWDDFGLSMWIVADEDDDAVLGNISLAVNPEREAGELGYWTVPAARGAGVMSAAARLVRDWAFDGLELQRLELTTDVDNIASQRVAQAIGMHREGLMRGYLTARGRRTDDLLYAMLPGDARVPVVPLPWPELRDDRLLVRPLREDDAAAVAVACADGAIQHWIYRLPSPYGLRDAQMYIAHSQRRLTGGDGLDCAVLDAATGELLGSVGMVVRLGADAACGEIGYWVASQARRRGVALSAARLLVDWAFEMAGLERLELLTYPGNTASQALAAKLGFTRLGPGARRTAHRARQGARGALRRGGGAAGRPAGRHGAAARRPGALLAAARRVGAARRLDQHGRSRRG